MEKRASSASVEGSVRDLTHGGDAVVETERGIVIARGALPGERVRLRLTGRVRGVVRGEIVAMLEPSTARRQPGCRLVEACGGCPTMAWTDAAQSAWKAARIARVLEQAGSKLTPVLITGPTRHYRVRARLAWSAEKRRVALGYHAAASTKLVDVDDCLVLREELALGFQRLRDQLGPRLEGEGEIALGLGAGGKCVAELTSAGPQPSAAYSVAEALVHSGAFAGIALRVGRGAARAAWGDPRQLSVGPDGEALWAPCGGFVQANAELNVRLVAEVAALAATAGARVLELYAGHGNFSVALAAGAAALRAIESDPEAVLACNENLGLRKLAHARALCDDAAHGAEGSGRIDVAVLDPPRAGAKELMPVLIAREPRRIVYVSCDPASLRRDLATLCAARYRIDAALAFDMFPQTTHVECVVRLQR